MYVRLAMIALCVVLATGCTARKSLVQIPEPPAPADQDKDGIPDVSDKCPAEPETINGYQDDDGCPDVVPPKLTFRDIRFALNSADIVDDTKGDLDVAAKIMAHDPAMRVRIEGHTDSYGQESYNIDLSRRRAESVKLWLVQKFGVDTGRIETAGFGSSRPIGSLSSPEGRKSSRRVEFVIVSRGK